MATAKPISSRKTAPFFAPEDIPHRIRDIALMRGLGYSFREIAQQFSVTPQAVSLMLSRHRRSLKSLNGAMELCHLSARAVNALGRHKISSRQEAREKNVMNLLRGERNCGRKTLEEIERWLSDGATETASSLEEAAC